MDSGYYFQDWTESLFYFDHPPQPLLACSSSWLVSSCCCHSFSSFSSIRSSKSPRLRSSPPAQRYSILAFISNSNSVHHFFIFWFVLALCQPSYVCPGAVAEKRKLLVFGDPLFTLIESEMDSSRGSISKIFWPTHINHEKRYRSWPPATRLTPLS